MIGAALNLPFQFLIAEQVIIMVVSYSSQIYGRKPPDAVPRCMARLFPNTPRQRLCSREKMICEVCRDDARRGDDWSANSLPSA